MKYLGWSALLALLAMAVHDAQACRTIPPMKAPVFAELARTSGIVAIVRVERVDPLTPEESDRWRRLMDDPPMNTPIRVPAETAHARTIRVLKGELPDTFPMRSGVTSCQVMLTAGRDYVVFTKQPETPDERYEPLYGTFALDGDGRGSADLAEVQASLSPSDMHRP